ncbi:MAG: glycoside hydrolase family 127 protein, partial [Crocinitomicaceae bacterium]|nr:glycoside hydrolase family 127 protein [Crocinitomicaceae bacterium]
MLFSNKLNILLWAVLLSITACNSIDNQHALPSTAKPFSLTQIQLLDGPFKHATELNIESLLQYDPDRLLARFRQEAGLEAKAESYGGWESESLAGHSLGHQLSACAFMYQTTGQDTFKNRAEYIVAELAEIQKANGDGYIGAFTNGKKIFEEEIKQGEIRSQGFDLNGLWSPFYTHHKVLAGLRDAYRLLGIEQALEVEKGFADWIGTIVLDLDHESVQKMLHCEFG